MEQLGLPAIWIPESLGSKDVLVHSGLLLTNTDKAIVAPGIANIHARDPMAMANGARALGEAYPGRFVLGIGVSHAPSVQMRGGDYGNPLSQIGVYLDAMDAAQYTAPEPDPPVPLVLAALGPGCSISPRNAPTAPIPTSCRSSTPPSPETGSAPTRRWSPR